MKIIEPGPIKGGRDSLQKAVSQVRRLLPVGHTGEQSEAALIARFMRGLDNRYIMLRHLPLEGPGVLFPPILIGPFGIVVLNLSHEQGFFKARDDTWWILDKSSQHYNPARPNLIKQSLEYAEKLDALLDAYVTSHPEVIPVLIFARSGVHIESNNPAVRIVLMDGIENLVSNVLNSDEVLQPEEISHLSDTLELMVNPEKAIPLGEGEDYFGRDLITPEKKGPFKIPAIKLPTQLTLPPIEEKIKLSQKQWVRVEVALLFIIVFLLGIIAVVLNLGR